MPASYEIRIHTIAGLQTALITDALEVSIIRRVNEPGSCSFVLPRGHSESQYLVDKAQVEIWRSDDGYNIAQYCEFFGLLRTRRTRGLPVNRMTLTCVGQMAMLGWRTVNFRAAVANRTLFTAAKAETILKTLVTYNATAAATVANARISDGTWPDRTITIQTDALGGNTHDWECAQKNLLATMKDLSRVAGGDFDLVKTGAATWDFRFYAGQLGINRTATVVISEEFGNMFNAEFVQDYTNEKTVAVVGGQGEKADRVYVTELGATHATTNKVETFVDGRSYATTAGLTGVGQSVLFQTLPTKLLTFSVLQIPRALYGVHYGLGDLVTVEFDGVTYTQKVSGVTITWNPSGAGGSPELITPELTNV